MATPLFRVERQMRPVVLVGIDPDTEELEGLVEAAGAVVVGRVVQHRRRPDARYFIGEGKAAELARRLALGDPPISTGGPQEGWLVVADAELKPSQVFNLEEALGVEVWDRIRLILEIFEANAHVKEARLQVELARLRYELPFVHEAIHRQRTGERPGFMGGGEYDVRTYETHLKTRTKKIKGELERITKERRARRAGRRRTGFRLAAIAGYTNAGKSRLLNALCGAGADVGAKYFSTLQTRTRRLKDTYQNEVGGPLLFTDTVGFIQDLPPWLIDAFGSTLEETVFADVILLVVDASEPVETIEQKLTAALEVLDEIGATKRILLVLNKQDKLLREQAIATLERLRVDPALSRHPYAWVSARTGEGLRDMLQTVWNEVLPTRQMRIPIDITRSDHATFESWLYDHAQVEVVEEEGGRRVLHVECSEEQMGNLLRQAAKAGIDTPAAAST